MICAPSFVLPSTPDYVVAYLAAAKVGAATSGVNPRLSPTERATVLDRAGADLILATDGLADGIPVDAPVELVTIGDGPNDLLGGMGGS